MIDNYNYSSQSLILITAIDLTQIPSLFISQPQMWDFSSSKLEFCSWQKRAQTRFPNNRWASSHISPRAEPPLLNRHFFSRLDQHIISKNPSWLPFARKGPPRSQLHSRKCFPTQIGGWRRPQLYPVSMTCLGLQWLQTKKLKCVKVSASSRQNLKIPAWDAGWELFPTTGLQGFPAGSLRAFEFFSAGCLGYLVIRGVMHKGQRWGEEAPQEAPVSTLLCPMTSFSGSPPGCSKESGHSPYRKQAPQDLALCHQPYFKETALSWGEWRKKCDQALEELTDFSVILFPDASIFPKVVFHPMVVDPSFSLFLWCGNYHHSIFGHFCLRPLILDLESKLTSLWCLSIGATEKSSSYPIFFVL